MDLTEKELEAVVYALEDYLDDEREFLGLCTADSEEFFTAEAKIELVRGAKSKLELQLHLEWELKLGAGLS